LDFWNRMVLGKACRTSSANTASAIPLRVVPRMPVALGFDLLRDLEFVGELEHGFSSRERHGSQWSDSRCWLGNL
jgi:hypothetical protein